MSEVDLTKFRQRVAERRARLAAENTPPPESAFDDTIPEAPFERSVEDQMLDDAINSIDIITAYNKWCGKMVPEQRAGQTEGIKISCPIPGHRDSNPSAWINTDKQTWYCGTCQSGGDAMDIAAFHFNYPVPGYKEGARFHELRRDMAKSMGYTFIKPPGAKAPVAVPPSTPEPVEADSTLTIEVESPGANVVQMFLQDEPGGVLPSLDWRSLVKSGTFLDTYMQCCIVDDVPEEYHFWNGLVALGLAVGRDVTLYDQLPVYGNLFICLLGNTGDGKSRSFSHLKTLLSAALPASSTASPDKGVVKAYTPASGESLIQIFSKPVTDPTNPKVILYYDPVRGLIEYNELSQLVGRGQRQGNSLKPTLMEFYDCSACISTVSVTGGRRTAENAFGSCVTTTQPKSLKDLVTNSDAGSGFLNRWVFPCGTPKEKVAIGGARVDTTPAVAPLQSIHGWAGLGKEIQWSDEANKRFTELFHTYVQPAKLNDETELLSRIDLLLKKLILLFCINEKQIEVSRDIVERVWKMWDYLLGTYNLPAEQIGNSIYYQIMNEVTRILKEHGTKFKNGMTMRDINRCLHRKKFPPPIIAKMLDYMVNGGLVEMIAPTNKTGPQTMRYRYVG